MVDSKNENLRFSRSGRILRKTLKLKEMEEVEMEESRLEKIYGQFPTSSNKIKTGLVPRSNSSGSSSSLSLSVSVDNSFNCETENANQYANSNSNNSSYFQTEDDNCSSDNSENWTSDSSSQGSSGSTNEANYSSKSMKSRFKTNVSRGKCMENVSSKRKITKSSLSASRKIIGLNKCKCKHSQPKKRGRRKVVYGSRRKASKNRKGNTTSQPKLPSKPFGSLKKPSHVLPEKGKENNVQGATGQVSLDSVDRSMQSVDLNLDSDKLEDPEQVTHHPLGTGPIDVAAHLMLLGDCLSRLGYILMSQHQQVVDGAGVYDALLSSLLCAVGPLLCLTKEIPGLEDMNEDVFVKILDHIAYIMPGL